MPSCAYADCLISLTVRGVILDVQNSDSIVGAPVGGRTITNGEVITETPAVDGNGDPFAFVTQSDGSFVLPFELAGLVPCPAPDFPKPNQVEIVIIRDGCEQRFAIEINEDTAQFVDGEFPGDEVLELTDPILVPRCEQSP